MQYRIHESDGTAVLSIEGQVVVTDRSEFAVVAADALARRPHRLVVDLGAVEFMDSAGLGLLLLLRDEALARQVKVILRGAQGQVRELFETAGFELLFPMAD
ncbi:MAG: STAS domain-containing protein [Magnetospirillum sp. WYHS-4]